MLRSQSMPESLHTQEPETPFTGMQTWNDTSPLHPGGPPTNQKIICLLSWRIENSHLSTGVQM